MDNFSCLQCRLQVVRRFKPTFRREKSWEFSLFSKRANKNTFRFLRASYFRPVQYGHIINLYQRKLWLTRYSRVLPMSKIDFTPADMTATGVFPNSVRSALTSIDDSAPRWTPPIPPVTKMGIPTCDSQKNVSTYYSCKKSTNLYPPFVQWSLYPQQLFRHSTF